LLGNPYSKLTADERKEVISARKKWEVFRKASYSVMEMLETSPNLLIEVEGDRSPSRRLLCGSMG